LPNILRATLEANIPDVAARQAAFDKLAELLMKESGVIRPFFPLTRKGAYRLMYNAYDPKTGTFESYTEYFDSPTLVRKAADAVLAYNANNAAMQARVDREVARKQSAGEPAVSRANIIKAMTAPKAKHDFYTAGL
jgi:isoleucyl-tRNA synthetase